MNNTPNSQNYVPGRINIIESFYNTISKKISPTFIFYNCNANYVTIISGIFGIFGSLFILYDDPYFNIVAFLFLNIFVVLDLVDGDIARYTKTTSLFGRWLDLFFDKLNEIFIISSLTYMSYIKLNDQSMLIIGFVLLIMHFSYQYIILADLYWFSNSSTNNNKSSVKLKDNKSSLGNQILVHLTLKHATLFFISSICVLLGKYMIALFILTILATLSVILSCIRNFIRLKNN